MNVLSCEEVKVLAQTENSAYSPQKMADSTGVRWSYIEGRRIAKAM